MSGDFCVNWDNLKTSAAQLRSKIDSAKQCYKNLDTIYKEIDGTTNTWYGKNQRKFYESYLTLSRNFPGEISKFEELYNHLIKAIEAYENSDNVSYKAADSSSEDLMV